MGALIQQNVSFAAKERPVSGTVGASVRVGTSSRKKPLAGVFAALLLFMVIYFARPGDWIPGFSAVPLAKISGILVLLALIFSLREIRQRLPREVIFLALLVGQLFLSSIFSPVWRGGALDISLNFSKVLIVALVVTAAVTSVGRLKALIFTQAVSVAAIAGVAIWKGRLIMGRLEGTLSGNYSDPNDLALAIVMSIPLCLALLILSRNWLLKFLWLGSLLMMTYAVLRTGSRGGFLALGVVAAACLWEFAIKGRRPYILGFALLAGIILWQSAGGMVMARLKGTVDANDDAAAAYASGQARQQLFWKSIDVTKEHPLFGVGPGNFDQVSGQWRTAHNSYTLLSSEAGLPALILYVLILWSAFKNLAAAKRRAPRRSEARLLAGALFASLAAYTIGSTFLSVAYTFFPYILVAYTSAIFMMARESAAQARKTEAVRHESPEHQSFLPAADPELTFLPAEIQFAPRSTDS